jgi:hypothetical protein
MTLAMVPIAILLRIGIFLSVHAGIVLGVLALV